MRKILLTSLTALALTSSAAFAGGTVEPVMAPEAVAPSSSSAGGLVIPLLLLLIVAIAVSNNTQVD